MNEFFKSVVGKCFLYTLLGIFIFASLTLFGCFISGNTDVLEWHGLYRYMIIVLSVVLTLGVKVFKQTK